MTQIAGKEITATANGASDSIMLPLPDHLIYIRSDAWGGATATVQISDGDDWYDAEDENGVIALTDDGVRRCPGGQEIRLSVASYSAAITLKARRCSRD